MKTQNMKRRHKLMKSSFYEPYIDHNALLRNKGFRRGRMVNVDRLKMIKSHSIKESRVNIGNKSFSPKGIFEIKVGKVVEDSMTSSNAVNKITDHEYSPTSKFSKTKYDWKKGMSSSRNSSTDEKQV
jgi:hypothetical protein